MGNCSGVIVVVGARSGGDGGGKGSCGSGGGTGSCGSVSSHKVAQFDKHTDTQTCDPVDWYCRRYVCDW